MSTSVHDPSDQRYPQTIFVSKTNPSSRWTCFAIVIGCNPSGKCISQHENDARTLAMLKGFTALGFKPIRMDGFSPSEQHRESSFAVPCDVDRGGQICLQYAQLAFYVVEHRERSFHDVGSERCRTVGTGGGLAATPPNDVGT